MRDANLNKLGVTYLTHLVRKESANRCIEPALLSFVCILFGFEYFSKPPHLYDPPPAFLFCCPLSFPHSPPLLHHCFILQLSLYSILILYVFFFCQQVFPSNSLLFFSSLSFFPSLTWHLAGQPASHQDKRYDLTSLQCSKDTEGDSKGKNKITWGGMREN